MNLNVSRSFAWVVILINIVAFYNREKSFGDTSMIYDEWVILFLIFSVNFAL